MKRAHKQSTKVLVDVSARVSSSRMNKAYEALRLQALDSHGRKKYLYGSNGRSVAYDDTMMLNYRKKAAWDLLL